MDAFKWANGNPGALKFLMTIMIGKLEDIVYGITIIAKLEKCTSIRGTNLYILYANLCNKDLEVCANLCKNCPDAILEDACNRQDRSGVALIKEYL